MVELNGDVNTDDDEKWKLKLETGRSRYDPTPGRVRASALFPW